MKIFLIVSLIWLVFIEIEIYVSARYGLSTSNYKLCPKSYTNTLKGIAITGIFFSHVAVKLLVSGTLPFVHYWIVILTSLGALGVGIFFFLSGYGVFLVVSRIRGGIKDKLFWFAQHIARLLISFVICYAVVVIFLSIYTGDSLPYNKIFSDIITLNMIDPPTWYIKVQFVLYILALLSFIISKGNEKIAFILIFVMILTFSIVLYVSGFSDFWWQNNCCFAIGCLCALKKKSIEELMASLTKKRKSILYIFWSVLFLSFYVAVMNKMWFGFRIIGRTAIAVSLVMIGDGLNLDSRFFKFLAKYSFELYLVHVGISETLFSENHVGNKEFIIYLFVTTIGMFIASNISKKIILALFSKKGKVTT